MDAVLLTAAPDPAYGSTTGPIAGILTDRDVMRRVVRACAVQVPLHCYSFACRFRHLCSERMQPVLTRASLG
jgi:hypothetical protein